MKAAWVSVCWYHLRMYCNLFRWRQRASSDRIPFIYLTDSGVSEKRITFWEYSTGYSCYKKYFTAGDLVSCLVCCPSSFCVVVLLSVPWSINTQRPSLSVSLPSNALWGNVTFEGHYYHGAHRISSLNLLQHVLTQHLHTPRKTEIETEGCDREHKVNFSPEKAQCPKMSFPPCHHDITLPQSLAQWHTVE